MNAKEIARHIMRMYDQATEPDAMAEAIAFAIEQQENALDHAIDRSDAAIARNVQLAEESEMLRAALLKIANMTLSSHTAQDNVMQDIARSACDRAYVAAAEGSR